MTGAPQRTCIACRQVRAKAALVRLVRGRDGQVDVDVDGVRPGRGAYACRSLSCLTQALARGRLDHAFRRSSMPPAGGATGILERLGDTTGGE